MNLIAVIPSGQTEIIVNGLHQWDYGRQLEIHSADLPALVEVHFACPGMDTAVVRSCNAVSGVVHAAIPDRCLEQTAPITAWVFEIDGTTGVTTKKITMPIQARVRPSLTEEIPTEVSDKYTEAITAVNDAVATLRDGDVKVANSFRADYATEAGLAQQAVEADSAVEAGTLNKYLHNVRIDVGDISGTGGDPRVQGIVYARIITSSPNAITTENLKDALEGGVIAYAGGVNLLETASPYNLIAFCPATGISLSGTNLVVSYIKIDYSNGTSAATEVQKAFTSQRFTVSDLGFTIL